MNQAERKPYMSSLRRVARSSILAVALGAMACGPADQAEGDLAPVDTALPVAASALTGSALFVVGNTALGAADTALRNRLGTLGLTVVVKSAVNATTADATGASIVLVAGSANSHDVNTKFRDVAI